MVADSRALNKVTVIDSDPMGNILFFEAKFPLISIYFMAITVTLLRKETVIKLLSLCRQHQTFLEDSFNLIACVSVL